MSEDDSTIKVAPKKPKDKTAGVIKLKKPAPKHSEPGNWQEGRIIDGLWFPPRSYWSVLGFRLSWLMTEGYMLSL